MRLNKSRTSAVPFHSMDKMKYRLLQSLFVGVSSSLIGGGVDCLILCYQSLVNVSPLFSPVDDPSW